MSRRRGSRRLPVAMRTGIQVTKEQKKESSKTGNKRKRYHGNREQVDRNSWAGKRRTGGQMLKDWEHDYRSQEDWEQKDMICLFVFVFFRKTKVCNFKLIILGET